MQMQVAMRNLLANSQAASNDFLNFGVKSL